MLDERPDGTTRLVTRNRLDYAPRTFGMRMMWEWITDPLGFVMTRRMLLGIKERAERMGGSVQAAPPAIRDGH